jgi:hypothetical protein
MGCSNSKVEPQVGGGGSAAGVSKGVSSGKAVVKGKNPNFKAIEDKFETLEEVSDSLKVAGLESSNLVRDGIFICSGRQRPLWGKGPTLSP